MDYDKSTESVLLFCSIYISYYNVVEAIYQLNFINHKYVINYKFIRDFVYSYKPLICNKIESFKIYI